MTNTIGCRILMVVRLLESVTAWLPVLPLDTCPWLVRSKRHRRSCQKQARTQAAGASDTQSTADVIHCKLCWVLPCCHQLVPGSWSGRLRGTRSAVTVSGTPQSQGCRALLAATLKQQHSQPHVGRNAHIIRETWITHTYYVALTTHKAKCHWQASTTDKPYWRWDILERDLQGDWPHPGSACFPRLHKHNPAHNPPQWIAHKATVSTELYCLATSIALALHTHECSSCYPATRFRATWECLISGVGPRGGMACSTCWAWLSCPQWCSKAVQPPVAAPAQSRQVPKDIYDVGGIHDATPCTTSLVERRSSQHTIPDSQLLVTGPVEHANVFHCNKMSRCLGTITPSLTSTYQQSATLLLLLLDGKVLVALAQQPGCDRVLYTATTNNNLHRNSPLWSSFTACIPWVARLASGWQLAAAAGSAS